MNPSPHSLYPQPRVPSMLPLPPMRPPFPSIPAMRGTSTPWLYKRETGVSSDHGPPGALDVNESACNTAALWCTHRTKFRLHAVPENKSRRFHSVPATWRAYDEYRFETGQIAVMIFIADEDRTAAKRRVRPLAPAPSVSEHRPSPSEIITVRPTDAAGSSSTSGSSARVTRSQTRAKEAAEGGLKVPKTTETYYERRWPALRAKRLHERRSDAAVSEVGDISLTSIDVNAGGDALVEE